MNIDRKQELLSIAEDWASNCIDNWLNESGAWDHLVEDELTEEELYWIQDNVKFNVNVEEI